MIINNNMTNFHIQKDEINRTMISIWVQIHTTGKHIPRVWVNFSQRVNSKDTRNIISTTLTRTRTRTIHNTTARAKTRASGRGTSKLQPAPQPTWTSSHSTTNCGSTPWSKTRSSTWFKPRISSHHPPSRPKSASINLTMTTTSVFNSTTIQNAEGSWSLLQRSTTNTNTITHLTCVSRCLTMNNVHRVKVATSATRTTNYCSTRITSRSSSAATSLTWRIVPMAPSVQMHILIQN